MNKQLRYSLLLLWLFSQVAMAQCPPPAPLSTPLLESWTTQPNNLIGTAAGTVAPNCWTLTSGAVVGFRWQSDQTTGANRFSTGTGPWFDNTQYGVAGGLYLFLETSSGVAGDSAFVVSPDINISNLTNPELRFFYHMYGATTGSMVAQVWNGSAWVTELTITGQQQTAGNAPWLEGVVSLAGYPSSIKVRFKGIRGTSFTGDMALDDISVAEAPACPNPTAPSVLSVSFNSANLNWNVGDINATSWQIEYGAPGFTPGTGTIVSGVNSVPYTLTGLSANTSYAFYVSETCVSGGSQSGQVGPVSFTTLCAPEVAPYTANFEGVQNQLLQDYNNCWRVPATTAPRWRAALSTGANQFSTNTGPWYDKTNYGLPGGTFMFLITSTGVQGGIGELHSPDVDLSGLTTPYVEFFYHMYGATMGTLYLDVQDTGGSWLQLTSISGQQQTSGSSPWLKAGVAVPTYINGIHKFRFRGERGSSFTGEMAIDDFVVKEAPACPDPSGVQITGVSGTTVNITVIGSGNFNVEWGPAGFVQGTGAVTPVTGPNFVLNGLNPLSVNDIYIQANCGANGVSSWVGPYQVTTGCAVFQTPYFENFATAAIGNQADFGNCWTQPATTGLRWEGQTGNGVNWSSLNTGPFWDNTTFGIGGGRYLFLETSSGTLGAIQPLFSPFIDASGLTTPYVEFYYHMYGATMGALRVDVWNATLGWTNDIITIVGQQQTSGPSPWEKIGAVLPAGYTGNIQLRFRGERGSSFTGDMAIDDVSLLEAPACPDVSSIVPVLIEGFQASIAWNGQGGSNFAVEWGPGGFIQGSGTVINTSNPNATITGLSPTTAYSVYIRNNCSASGNGLSNWVGPFNFTTTVSCPAPTSVLASPGTFSAGFSWSTGGASHVNYVIGLAGTTPSTGVVQSATVSPIQVTGLTPSTNYTFWVRDSCGLGDVSTWVGPLNFNTLCVPASMPYSRDFNTWPPLCWDLTGGTQTVAQNSNNYMFANFWGWTSGNFALASTEPITISQNARVKFRWSHLYSTTYPLDQMILRVRLANGTVWDTLINKVGPSFTTPGAANTAPAPDANFISEVINLNPSYTGQDVVFQFRFNSGFGPSVYVDDFSVEQLPACPEPTTLIASNPTSNSVSLSWANGNPNATAWYLEYGPPGFAIGTGSLVTASSNPFVLSGLNPATSYSVRVAELCANGVDTSTFSNSAGFSTLCAPVSAPYLQTFTGIQSGILGTTPPTTLPNCFELGRDGTTGTYWYTHLSTGANFSSTGTGPWFDATTPTTPGGGYVFLETSSGAAGSKAPFVSPEIVTTALTNPNLSFAYHMYGATTDSLRVDVFSNGAWVNNVWSIFGQQQTAGNAPWATANVPLFSFGDTIRVRFIGRRGTSFTGDMALDDVGVDEAPACPDPFQLSASNVGAFTATLSWQSGAPAASTWFIEYGPTGFALGSGITVMSSVDSVVLTGLNAASGYQFYVSELCPNGTDTSNWAGPGAFNTLCAPVNAPYLQTFTGIQSGILGATPPITLPNCFEIGRDGTTGTYWYTHLSTGANFSSTGTGPWFDATTPTTPGGGYVFLETSSGAAGSKAPFVSPEIVTTALTNPNLSFSYHMYGATMDSLRVDIFSNGAWVNNVWSIFGQQQTAGNAPWLTANVGLVGFGDTIRVRFIGRRGTSFTGDLALDDIRVDEAPACFNPSLLQVVSVNSTDATLAWTNGDSNATTWFIEYGPIGFSPGTGTTVLAGANPFVLSGLQPSTAYSWYIRELCPNALDTSLLVGPNGFTTLCVNAAIPYLRDFNSWPPQCWDLSGGTQTVAQNSSNYLFANFWGWTSGNFALASTEPILISTDARVRFRWSHLYNTTYPLDQLLVMARLTTSSTWDTLLNLVGSTFTTPGAANTAPAPDANFVPEVINLNPSIYTGNDVVFMLRFNSGFGPNVYIDDFVVEPLPACPEPSGLIAQNVTSNSVDLSWSNGASAASSWFIEYGPPGFLPGTGTLVTANSNPFTLTGLSAATSYGVRVAELCPNGQDTSNFSNLIAFNTLCAPVSAPYLQTFTGIQSGILGATPPITLPNCFELGRDGTTGTYWYTHNATGANFSSTGTGPWFDATTPTTPGGGYVFLETSSGAAGSKAPFVSPEIVTTALTNPNLSFAYHMYGATTDSLRVDIFSNGTWVNNVWSIFGQQQTAGNAPWLNANVSLATFGDTIRVRFIGRRGTSFTGDMAIDDVRVDEAPACPNPSQLAATSITSNSAILSWTSGSPGANNWIIEFGPAGFALGTGTSVSVGTNPYTLGNLSASSSYHFYIKEICPNGIDTSIAVGPLAFSTACGPAMAPYIQTFTGIATGSIGTTPPLALSNCWELGRDGTTGTYWYTHLSTGANFSSVGTGPWFDATTPTTAGGGYVFLETSSGTAGSKAPFISPEIIIGHLGLPTLEFAYHMYGATMDSLRVDVLSNGAWVNNVWSIFGQQQTAGNASWDTANVSLAGFSDTIRLRFVGRRGSSFTGDMALDDIRVFSPGNPNCPNPMSATASVNCSTATITWISGSGTSYIEYGPSGFAPGSGTVVSPAVTGAVISGLAYGTSYQAFVYDVCNNGLDTSIAVVAAFSTPQPPIASFTTNITQGTVTFNASASTGATNFIWVFGDGNSGTGANTTHTYAANGSYQVTLTVTDACGQTASTTQTIQITSIATCPQASGLTASGLECNSVDLNWNSLSGNSVLQYGPIGFTPGTGTFVTATSQFTLTGLNPGSGYHIWVADLCSGGTDTSLFAGPITVTTPTGPLPTITGVTFIQSSTTAVDATGDFTANGTDVSAFEWDFGNGGTATGNNVSGIFLQNGTYFITLTARNACGSVDSIFSVNIVGISLNEDLLNTNLRVYPNPTSADFILSMDISNGSRDFEVELMDGLGRVIEKRQLMGIQGHIEERFDLTHVPKGIYSIRIKSGNSFTVRRINRI